MNYLGVDYGRKKIGIAVGDSESKLTSPLLVIKVSSENEVLDKISEIVKKETIDELVVGVSEGGMGKETKDFGEKLKQSLGLPINYSDETLTTTDAQEMAISAGHKRKKRKEMEDAFSASIILQNFFDTLT